MRQIIEQNRFRRDYKRLKKRGKDLEKLEAVVFLLASDGRLDSSYQPHKLSGEYEGLWECHIEHDWLLIYDVTDTEVLLARTGSHSDLFE